MKETKREREREKWDRGCRWMKKNEGRFPGKPHYFTLNANACVLKRKKCLWTCSACSVSHLLGTCGAGFWWMAKYLSTLKPLYSNNTVYIFKPFLIANWNFWRHETSYPPLNDGLDIIIISLKNYPWKLIPMTSFGSCKVWWEKKKRETYLEVRRFDGITGHKILYHRDENQL